jgi:G protein-coupled receptor Mth (Methuselah protein)
MVQLKVTILTGVTWAGEIISWTVGGPAQFWYLTDLLNSLQGVFIFVLFVCKPSSVRTFRRRFSRNPPQNTSFHYHSSRKVTSFSPSPPILSSNA